MSKFLMAVQDVFPLSQGRLVMLSGQVERGRVKVGQEVEVIGSGACTAAVITAIEDPLRRGVDAAEAGMNVGLSFAGLEVSSAEPPQVVASPGTITTHRRFRANVIALEQAEGAIVATSDRFRFHIRAAVVLGTLRPIGEVSSSGIPDTFDAEVALETPVALEVGQRFAFRHRGQATGSGVVTAVI